MQHRGEQHILLNDVGWQTEASPIQAHIKVTISVEVIGAKEDVQVTYGVNNHEDEEEHG